MSSPSYLPISFLSSVQTCQRLISVLLIGAVVSAVISSAVLDSVMAIHMVSTSTMPSMMPRIFSYSINSAGRGHDLLEIFKGFGPIDIFFQSGKFCDPAADLLITCVSITCVLVLIYFCLKMFNFLFYCVNSLSPVSYTHLTLPTNREV